MHKETLKYIILLCLLWPFMASASSAWSGELRHFASDSISQNDSTPQNDLGQVNTVKVDSLLRDTTLVDTLLRDTTQVDSLQVDSLNMRPIKKAFLDAPIIGNAKDSLVYNVKGKTITLHNKGEVTYQKMNLKAEYININTATKNVRAEGRILDTTSKEYVRPIFKEGEQQYDVDSMDYNMESGKGLIKGVNTKEGEGTIYGGTVKKMKDNTVHMHQGRYTVCDANCPHFYLQMTKGSTVPGKETVFGPSYMVFEDVPVYFLGLPFGFFPQKRERNHGIIFPEIGEEYIKGFFIRNLGYYVPIGDYFDVRVMGGIYTLGSWQMGLGSNYALRYKFNGSVSFDYASDKIGDVNSPDYVEQTNISLRWTHRQDAKFSPGSAFSASVNYTSSNYNKFNAQNINDYLNTQTSSSVSFSKSWAGTPFSLAVNADMSQYSRDSTFTLNLPNFTFNVARVSPFKRKVAIGKERWYEKINFTYSMNFKNEAQKVKETNFFKQKMFDDMRMGIQQNIPFNATFTVAQYLNITPQLTYRDRIYFRRIDQRWDGENEKVAADTSRGIYHLFELSASLSFGTKLYGTYELGSGRLKKKTILRHVLTPSITTNFTPDNGTRYYKSVQTNADATQFRDYSPWSNEMYGVPGRGAAASLAVSLNNTLEGKFASDKDSTGYKKVKIIEQFNLGASYNFIADSMNLSNISMNISTNLFNGKLPLSFQASFDPYAVDKSGNRINKFLVKDGGFLRLANLSFSLGYSWQSKASKASGKEAVNNPSTSKANQQMVERGAMNEFFDQNQEVPAPSQRELAAIAATQYYDFNIPWSFGFSYTFNYSDYGRGPTLQQAVSFNGSLNITSKWAVSASAGYDFQLKKLTPGSIRITRDLHCWQMSFQWVPVGFRQSWSFNIAVKSSMLSDLLKWDKNNSYMDNYYRNR